MFKEKWEVKGSYLEEKCVIQGFKMKVQRQISIQIVFGFIEKFFSCFDQGFFFLVDRQFLGLYLNSNCDFYQNSLYFKGKVMFGVFKVGVREDILVRGSVFLK